MPYQSRTNDLPKALRGLGRLKSAIEREGPFALARRKLSQLVGLIAERYSIWRMRRRPWRTDDRAVFLMISHRCGGGTERQLGELESSLRAEGMRPIIVRPGRKGTVLWEERDSRRAATWCRESSADCQSIGQVLATIKPRHAHVHHAMGLPEALFDLLIEQNISYDWSIHDYHAICPRVHLIGARGRYCGEPDQAGCNQCLARLGDDQGRPVADSIAVWRTRSERRLRGARRVFAPSDDVARRLARYFPGRSVVFRPHAESLPSLQGLAAPWQAGETVRVALIGTLVAMKGAERLIACARDAAIRGLPLEFHVIGSTDRDAAFARAGNVHVTGRYLEHEVYDRLARERCHVAFLPSECPESFMYTLSIAMAAGMFVVCFDLGAQAERVRAWGWGRLLEVELEPAAINDALLAAARSVAASPAPPQAPAPAQYPEVLASYYEFTQGERDRLTGSASGTGYTPGSSPHAARGRDHARLR